MKYFLAQIILAARNGDGEGWINILVLVAIAIFYAVGSILKAKTSKAEQKGDEQLARKPPVGTKDLQKQPLEWPQRSAGPPPRRRIIRPQPAVDKFVTKKEPSVWPQTLEPLKVPKFVPLEPQLQAELEELPEFIDGTVKKQEYMPVGIPSKTEQPETIIESPLDFDDPDMLRKAILHYEILGKPLSLRGPSEHIAGL